MDRIWIGESESGSIGFIWFWDNLRYTLNLGEQPEMATPRQFVVILGHIKIWHVDATGNHLNTTWRIRMPTATTTTKKQKKWMHYRNICNPQRHEHRWDNPDADI
jgi:hypothetical protein